MMKSLRGLGGVALLVVVSLVLGAYLMVGVLRLNPLADQHTVTVHLDSSGGLQPNSTVVFNGIEVGKVRSIDTRSDGLSAVLRLDANREIPVDADINVANLSMVGEQYLSFTSTVAHGPYVQDGAVLDKRVRSGVSVADMLASVQGLTGQIDTATLDELARTLTEGWRGREQDLDRIGDFASRTARTIGTYRSEFADVFEHAQELLKRTADNQIPDALRDAAPKLRSMNIPFSTAWSVLQGFSVASDGPAAWYDVIIPFTVKIGSYLKKILPDASAVIAVLQPTMTQVAPAFRMDMAALVSQALQIVDENGVLRIRVAPPR